MSVRVSINVSAAAESVADVARRGASSARTATSRMMTFGSEDRAARDEVLIRLRDLRGSIEALKQGTCANGIAGNRTQHADATFGTAFPYGGYRIVVRRLG